MKTLLEIMRELPRETLAEIGAISINAVGGNLIARAHLTRRSQQQRKANGRLGSQAITLYLLPVRPEAQIALLMGDPEMREKLGTMALHKFDQKRWAILTHATPTERQAWAFG